MICLLQSTPFNKCITFLPVDTSPWFPCSKSNFGTTVCDYVKALHYSAAMPLNAWLIAALSGLPFTRSLVHCLARCDSLSQKENCNLHFRCVPGDQALPAVTITFSQLKSNILQTFYQHHNFSCCLKLKIPHFIHYLIPLWFKVCQPTAGITPTFQKTHEKYYLYFILHYIIFVKKRRMVSIEDNTMRNLIVCTVHLI